MQKERPTVSLALQFKPFHREAFCRFPEGTLGRAAATPRTNLGVPSHPLSPPRKGDQMSPLRGGERGIRAFSGRAPVNSGCPLFSLRNRLRYVYIHTQTARSRSRLRPRIPLNLQHIRHTKGAPAGAPFVWRRERDSNPRKLSLQRFSRPPHSTALPSLRKNSQKNF